MTISVDVVAKQQMLLNNRWDEFQTEFCCAAHFILIDMLKVLFISGSQIELFSSSEQAMNSIDLVEYVQKFDTYYKILPLKMNREPDTNMLSGSYGKIITPLWLLQQLQFDGGRHSRCSRKCVNLPSCHIPHSALPQLMEKCQRLTKSLLFGIDLKRKVRASD